MGLALEKDAEECYSVDMNDAVRHGMCVSILASELARELGCDEEFIHKAMKIEEMRYVRLHAKLGAEILKREGYDQDIVDMVHYHHENYDGSGYPYRMRGEEIPLGARLIRVCDVFSALVSDRPYRKAFDADTAFGMVIDEVRHFDMRAFLAFQRLINTTDIMSRVDQVLHGDIPGLDEK